MNTPQNNVDESLGYYGTDYTDPREAHDSPADLSAILDDEERETALTTEDQIKLYQKPWVKVSAVLAMSTAILGCGAMLFLGTQPKTVSQLPAAQRGKDTGSTYFGTDADDASKTEIALGTQRKAFEGSASPSPSPMPSGANATPSPSVVINPPVPQPSPSIVVTAPSSQPTPTPTTLQPVRSPTPVARKVVASTITKPTLTLTPVKPVRPPAPVADKAVPPVVARIIPLAAPAQPLRQLTPVASKAMPPAINRIMPLPTPIATMRQPVSVASLTPRRPITMASLATKPQSVTQAVLPVSRPASIVPALSPEDQWLKMSDANRFGGKYADAVVASNSIPPTNESSTPPGSNVLSVPAQIRIINIGNSTKPAVEENLVPVSNVPVVTPTTAPTNGFQPVSFIKDELKPLQTEFGVINGSGKPTQYIIPPGTRFAGTLLTPVQAAGSSSTEQFLAVQLDQPILDKDRRVAIAPQNTQMIFRWSLTDGWIQATSESLVIDGRSIAVSGAFVLQGNDGQPLVASTYQPGAGEVAAADQNSFLLGAAKGVGEVLTAPDTTIATNGLGGITSTSTANRNVLGAVLRGGTDPVLQGWSQRNLQRSQAVQSRKPIWYLQPGTRVNIFTTTPLTLTN